MELLAYPLHTDHHLTSPARAAEADAPHEGTQGADRPNPLYSAPQPHRPAPQALPTHSPLSPEPSPAHASTSSVHTPHAPVTLAPKPDSAWEMALGSNEANAPSPGPEPATITSPTQGRPPCAPPDQSLTMLVSRAQARGDIPLGGDGCSAPPSPFFAAARAAAAVGTASPSPFLAKTGVPAALPAPPLPPTGPTFGDMVLFTDPEEPSSPDSQPPPPPKAADADSLTSPDSQPPHPSVLEADPLGDDTLVAGAFGEDVDSSHRDALEPSPFTAARVPLTQGPIPIPTFSAVHNPLFQDTMGQAGLMCADPGGQAGLMYADPVDEDSFAPPPPPPVPLLSSRFPSSASQLYRPPPLLLPHGSGSTAGPGSALSNPASQSSKTNSILGSNGVGRIATPEMISPGRQKSSPLSSTPGSLTRTTTGLMPNQNSGVLHLETNPNCEMVAPSIPPELSTAIISASSEPRTSAGSFLPASRLLI